MKCDKNSLLLYAVTDRTWLGNRTLYEQVEEALKGGATFIQLREKGMEDEAFLKEAFEIKDLCGQYNVPFVVNDNVEIAVKVNADGYVDIVILEEKTAPYACELEAQIPTTDGDYFTVTDYASAGKLWTEESKMAVWMNTK